MRTVTGIWLFPFFNIMVCVIGVLLLIGATVVGFSIDVAGISSTHATLTRIDENYPGSPLYIEWDGKCALVHPTMRKTFLKLPPFDLSAGHENFIKQIESETKNSELGTSVRCAAESGGRRFIVVLVRPTGFNNFLYLREWLISKNVILGYEPIGQYWTLEPSGMPCP